MSAFYESFLTAFFLPPHLMQVHPPCLCIYANIHAFLPEPRAPSVLWMLTYYVYSTFNPRAIVIYQASLQSHIFCQGMVSRSGFSTLWDMVEYYHKFSFSLKIKNLPMNHNIMKLFPLRREHRTYIFLLFQFITDARAVGFSPMPACTFHSFILMILFN